MVEVLKSGIVLFIVTLVIATSLGYVYEITKEPIEIASQKDKNSAMQKILPLASEFKNELKTNDNELVTEILTGYNGSTIAGYVLTTKPKGYAGEMQVLVALNTEGVIEGIDVKGNETPGLGANASNPSFTAQYINKSGVLSVTKGTPKDNEIEAITSATITSKAVTLGVNAALDFYKTNIAKGGN